MSEYSGEPNPDDRDIEQTLASADMPGGVDPLLEDEDFTADDHRDDDETGDDVTEVIVDDSPEDEAAEALVGEVDLDAIDPEDVTGPGSR